MSKACLASGVSPSDNAACFFPVNFLKFTKNEVFVLNSMYDNWAISNAFAPSASDKGAEWRMCAEDLARCTESQMSALHGFKEQMVHSVREVLKGQDETPSRRKDGAFLLGCHIHCQSLWANTWHGPHTPKIQEKTLAAAVGEWFTGGTPNPILIDCSYPCNPTCFHWAHDGR